MPSAVTPSTSRAGKSAVPSFMKRMNLTSPPSVCIYIYMCVCVCVLADWLSFCPALTRLVSPLSLLLFPVWCVCVCEEPSRSLCCTTTITTTFISTQPFAVPLHSSFRTAPRQSVDQNPREGSCACHPQFWLRSLSCVFLILLPLE